MLAFDSRLDDNIAITFCTTARHKVNGQVTIATFIINNNIDAFAHIEIA